MIRQSLLLAACALAPFVLSGCADDTESSEPSAVSPAPAAEALSGDLAGLASRIRSADTSLARLVADSVTDPEDRAAELAKASASLGKDSASSLGEKLLADAGSVVAGWDAALAAASDAEMRKVVAAGRDEAKARLDALAAALRGADASLAYHAALLREVRAALGTLPTASQRVAARPVSTRVTDAGNKAVAWLNHATLVAKKAGAAPLPAPAIREPKTGEAAPAPEAPGVITPSTPTAPAAVTPAPVEPTEPAEPKPVARPDPVPEPIDA